MVHPVILIFIFTQRSIPKAASLGLDTGIPSGDWPSSTTFYRGSYRGRARGRGFFRGASWGAPPKLNMTLDNRPKKLLLKGVKNEQIQTVKDWYQVCHFSNLWTGSPLKSMFLDYRSAGYG